MKTAPLVLCLVVALATALPGHAAADAPPPPLQVVSASVGPVAIVAWVPPATTEIVTYNVYGVDDGALVFLEATEATVAEVLGGFESYAVSAVDEYGAESEPTHASASPCVKVGPSPPYVWLCTEIG